MSHAPALGSAPSHGAAPSLPYQPKLETVSGSGEDPLYDRARFNRKMDVMGYSRTKRHVSAHPGSGAKYKGQLLRYLKTSGH